MPSTEFNWRDESGAIPKKSKQITPRKETIPYLEARINTLEVRLKKSGNAVEKADIADEISRCQAKIRELQAGNKKLRAKPVSDAPSVADKDHRNRMTADQSGIVRGQIVGNSNMFVSIL